MLEWKMFMFLFLGKNVSLGSREACLSNWGSVHLGGGGKLLDGTVVVLGGESFQGAPAVRMQLDDLHEE